MRDPVDGSGTPFRTPPASGICAAVAARVDELVAGDVPAAMRRELEPHVRTCARCRAELESFAALTRELRALPVTASPARCWSAIARTIALERSEQPVPWLVQAASLAAAALLLATLLVRNSVPLAERLQSWGLELPLLRGDLLPVELAPWLLPALFVFGGAVAAMASIPLLIARGRTAPAMAP
jgi:anti-sigma factor RsiW